MRPTNITWQADRAAVAFMRMLPAGHPRAWRRLALLVALVACAAAATSLARRGGGQPSGMAAGGAARPTVSLARLSRSDGTHHYLYVFAAGAMYVYDIDHRHRLLGAWRLPGGQFRGEVASPITHMLYVSHGGDGGANGTGRLLAYDLISNRVRWDRGYGTGVDSPALSRDGSRIYLPDGAASSDGVWLVVDARTGRLITRIRAGSHAHDTVVGVSGRRVYLGGTGLNFLEIASARTNRLIGRIGPLYGGVRPFTVNGRETLAFTSATGLLGFQVGSIATGRVLFTVRPPQRFRWDPSTSRYDDPSHGISLTPDERQVWIVDAPNSFLHVFDLTGLPSRPPRPIADIRLAHPFSGDETGCAYACYREGWVLVSRSGCYIYVGDSGDVYSALTDRPVAFLAPLRNTRDFLEIDWRAGRPVATTSRFGLGYVTGRRPPPPTCRAAA
jgi:hypothetical protein